MRKLYVALEARFAEHDMRERGATMVEYALMLALIAAVCVAAVTTIGTNAVAKFTDVAGKLG